MGNTACGGCCSWIFPSELGYDKDGKRSKTVLLDEENTWFEQDTVPLVSARYDNDDIGSDCVVTKTVVMRSPRATTAAAAAPVTFTAAVTSTSSKSVTSKATSKRSSKLTKPPSRGLICIDKSDDESEAQIRATRDQSTRRESHEHHRHADRSSSVESVGSRDSLSSSSTTSLTASSHQVVVQEGRAAAETIAHEAHDAAAARHDDRGDQPSSPKSPSKGSKTPDSPKKGRYGRKNYRANSGRKKNE